ESADGNRWPERDALRVERREPVRVLFRILPDRGDKERAVREDDAVPYRALGLREHERRLDLRAVSEGDERGASAFEQPKERPLRTDARERDATESGSVERREVLLVARHVDGDE